MWIPAFAGMTESAPAIDVSGAPADGNSEHRWIPAFAGMTESAPAIDVSGAPADGNSEHRWIPAFAGMTESAPAIDVSGAPADGNSEHRWIPAFAGMTIGGLRAYAVRTIIPAFAGTTIGGLRAYAVRTIIAAFAGTTIGGLRAYAVRTIIPAFAGTTAPTQLMSFPRRRESMGCRTKLSSQTRSPITDAKHASALPADPPPSGWTSAPDRGSRTVRIVRKTVGAGSPTAQSKAIWVFIDWLRSLAIRNASSASSRGMVWVITGLTSTSPDSASARPRSRTPRGSGTSRAGRAPSR